MFHEPLTEPSAQSMSGYLASGAWICHTGKVRKINEDACLFGTPFSGASASAPTKVMLDKLQWIIAAADGIGGHKAGAFASREVVVSLSECKEITPEGINHNLLDTNRRLHQEGTKNSELIGTGAAVAGMFATPDNLYAFNVGDARLYRQEGGRLKQMTEDDSVEQMLIREGLMKGHGGIRPASMHALTQSVGGSRDYHEIEPHFYLLPITTRARFILCTDGLTDMLSLKEMERVVIPVLNPTAAVQALFTASMDAGGKDNITICVVDIEKVP